MNVTAEQRRTHPHSGESLRLIFDKVGKRQSEILQILREHSPCTDREVLEHLCATVGGPSDMNRVRPRITELIYNGHAREVGEKRCHQTGRNVRVVEAV